jgi:probable rRNA maturation factor
MKLVIVNESSLRAPRKFLQESCDRIAKEFLRQRILTKAQSSRELTVVFLDPAAAKRTNSQFRKKNYATDVLSFEAMEPGSFGELILCPQVLKRQAKEHGLSYREELLYMLLHGLLHLLGYDHEAGEKQARVMFDIQDKAFAKLLK